MIKTAERNGNRVSGYSSVFSVKHLTIEPDRDEKGEESLGEFASYALTSILTFVLLIAYMEWL